MDNLVPLKLESKETYEYLGFRPDIAAAIWSNWINMDPQDKEDFTDFFEFGQLYITNNQGARARTASDAWKACMQRMGITDSFASAILNPEFRDLRFTEEASFWVRQAMRDEFEYLKLRIEPSVTRHDHVPTTSAIADAGQASRVIQAAPASASKSTVFWRAETCDRALSMYGGRGLFKGDANFARLLSSPPSDFSGAESKLYFSTQVEFAQLVARYRLNNVEGKTSGRYCLIRLEVPDHVVETLQLKQCTLDCPSEDFKKVVWKSRRAESIAERELRYVRESDFVHGNVCVAKDTRYEDTESWREITERNLLRIPVEGKEVAARQTAITSDTEVLSALAMVCYDLIDFRRPEDPSERMLGM